MNKTTYTAQDITSDVVWSRFPMRVQDSHKGTYGKLLCIAGSSRFRGAAALCVEGALRGGCGIVTLASIEKVFSSVQARLPECIFLSCRPSDAGGIGVENTDMLSKELMQDYSALLMGPGMGNTTATQKIVTKLILRADCPVILDADALNSIADDSEHAYMPHPKSGHPLIITPHPGEMARLCGCSVGDIKKDKENIAVDFATANNCVVVLKDHITLVASPEGQLWKNTTGNSGLARGGSGDILAGMIGAFTAQGMKAEDAAVCAVWLHGAAAVRCSEDKSETAMLPHDIFKYLGEMLREVGR